MCPSTHLASKICEPSMDTLGGNRVISCTWQSKSFSICQENPWKCRTNFQNYRRLSEQSFESYSYVWGYMKAVTSSVKKVLKRFSESVSGNAEANKNIKFNFLHNKASRIFKSHRCSLLILFKVLQKSFTRDTMIQSL